MKRNLKIKCCQGMFNIMGNFLSKTRLVHTSLKIYHQYPWNVFQPIVMSSNVRNFFYAYYIKFCFFSIHKLV